MTIEGERGTLLEDLHFDKLTIKNEQVHLELTDIGIEWSSVIVRNKQLNIKKLSAERLTIYLPESQKDPNHNAKVIIPTIPIPLDLSAGQVQLKDLRIINAKQELLFQSTNMSVKNAQIVDNLLTVDHAKATLMIKKVPMLVNLQQAQLDFALPHDIKGHGGIHYSNMQAGTFDGKVSVSGTLTDYQLAGTLDWGEPILGHSDVQFKAQGDYSGATIEQLVIDNKSALLETQGTIRWQDHDHFRWKFSIRSDEVRTKKYRPDWPATFALVLAAEGDYDYNKQTWSVLLDTKKLQGRVGSYPLQASGKIIIKDSFDLFLIKKIDLLSGDNRLKIDGKITEPMQLTWHINANELAQFLPSIKGKVVGKGVLTGTTLKLGGKGNLLINNLVSQDMKVGFADVKFKAGKDGLLRSGTIKSRLKAVQYHDVSVAAADIDFKGNTHQSLLLGRGTVDLERLKTKQLQFQSANIKFDGSAKKLDLDGTIKALVLDDKIIDNSHFSVKGKLEKHRIVLNSRSKMGNLQLNAAGGIKDKTWRGKASQLRLNNTVAGNWQLKQPVKIQASDQHFSSSEMCFNNPKRGLLCATFGWQKEQGITTKGTLKRVPLAQFKPWLPQALDVVGSIKGRYTIRQQGSGFLGQADFVFPDSLVRYQTTTGVEKIPYRNGKVSVNLNGHTINAKAAVQLDEWGKIDSEATILLSPNNKQHKITGEARFSTKRLDWFNAYLPDINRLKGKVSSKVKVNGLLAKPRVTAEFLLKNGQMSIPDTGATLSNIDLQIKTDQRDKARIRGSLLAGDGRLTITGWLDYAKRATWVADVKLVGNDLHVMNTHEVQAYASPAITIKATPKHITVLGRLHIPRAKITLDEIPETAVYESEDVVFVNDNNKPQQRRKAKQKNNLQISPNINITLGNAIQFKGFGLTGRLRGNFNVAENLNTISSRGTLSVIDGEYRAYGQVLTIEQGMLLFNGPVNNPGLNIRATRDVEDLKVGLNLAGTLKAPKSSIFSDPTLPEDEALSYLLTGQGLTGENDANTQLLLQAVRSLGISGGGNLLNRFGDSIGIDDVNVISFDDYKKNKIQLGKKLGADLYVRYITGLFDTFHKIAIDYRMSNKWSVQAETGEEQSIDFIYEFR